jgi:tripartite-type tricarboxylate transporter receptor subunit TctC
VAYDCTRDFTFIMQFAFTPSGLVVQADSPWKTLKEFVEHAKANPGKVRYSTAGPGSPSHLAMEQFTRKAGIKCIHIPFEGTAPSIAAVLGGHVEACADSVFWKPHVLSGKLRLLAGLDEKRIGFAPDVPTVTEAGYDITPVSLLGVVGPKGLSPQVVATLHNAYKKAIEDPDFVNVMNKMDMVFSYRGPQDFEKYITNLNAQLGVLFREIGIQKQ